MTRQRLVICGAGCHGREVLDVVEAMNRGRPVFDVVGFVDDGEGPWPLLDRRAVAVVGSVAALGEIGAALAIGIGNPGVRRRIDALATAAGVPSATLVHPASTTGSDFRLGDGTLLAAGARVTTNVVTGRHVHLNVNSTLSHDCRVGNYVTLNAGAHVNGAVTIGHEVTVGSGAVVREGLTIGDRAVIAAGAVVVTDVAADSTVVGVPAKPTPP